MKRGDDSWGWHFFFGKISVKETEMIQQKKKLYSMENIYYKREEISMGK